MPYGVGVYRYNEPIRRQSNLYPTANYRRYPPGLGGCLGCGLGEDASSSSWLELVGAAAGFWGIKKLTNSFLLGIVGGYVAYEVLSPTPVAATAPTGTSLPTLSPADVGCSSPWAWVDNAWTCS